METATLFTVGFANKIPTGAILLVSDQPMVSEGVKTSKSDNLITKNYVDNQIKLGITALREIENNGKSVRHLKWN